MAPRPVPNAASAPAPGWLYGEKGKWGSDSSFSLPEFLNFELFGRTILVANIKFVLFLGHPLSQ